MKTRLPLWFYLGLLANVLGWVISWLAVKPFSYYSFIFIWGGFIFLLDGINYRIVGSSIFSRNKKIFILLFLLSSIFCWYFEIVVMGTKNWYYISSKVWTIWEHLLFGTLFFSTVIPAVLEIVEFLTNFTILGKEIKWIKLSKQWFKLSYLFAFLSLILPIIWPQYFFSFIWISMFFILDPINHKLGFDSLIDDATKGKWKRIFLMAIGTLLCGLLWEMWNLYADPKWIYEVPFLGYFQIFEMPILGFIGYLPFGLEVFSFYTFFKGILGLSKEEIFTLEQKRVFIRNNKSICSIILLVLIGVLAVNGAFGYLQKNYIETNFSRSLELDEINNFYGGGTVFSGDIKSCRLGLVMGSCIETDLGERYWIVDEAKISVKITPAEDTMVVGKKVSQIVGADLLVVSAK